MPNLLPRTRMIMTGLLLLTAGSFVTGCKPNPAPENVIEEPNGLIPQIPTETTMDRAAILTAVATAASDYAAAIDDQRAQASLEGKRFEFRIPFGCPSDISILMSQLKLAIRPNGKAFEVSAAPDITINEIMPFFPPPAVPVEGPDNAVAANISAAAKPAIEVAEGFWIPRPWMLTDKCPAGLPSPVPEGEEDEKDADKSVPTGPAQPAPTVGIVQYYGPNDSRVGFRSGKPLSKIETIGALNGAPADGATLVLEGRLRHWPNGKVIQCRWDAAAGPPQCLISATIDHISIVRADTGKTIAEWTR